MKDVRNIFETMIQSTTSIATTAVAAAVAGKDDSPPANGSTPLIAVNASPFLTPMPTPKNNRFVTPRMIHAMSHDD